MSKRMVVALVVMLILYVTVLGSQCGATTVSQPNSGLPAGIGRFVDSDAGVVCWTLYTDGISCLPIEETRIR